MNASVFDYAVCAAVICVFVYGWGLFRKRMAYGKFRKTRELLSNRQYKESIVIYQDIASEMQREPEYWYNLAVALIGAGSVSDARSALDKLLRLNPRHEGGMRLREALDRRE